MTIDEGVAIIIAAVLAIAGIFYASRQQRKMLRKQHTYQVIDKLNDWPEFDKKLDFARKLTKERRVLRLCDEDKADCDEIDFLLNYYEFLSAAIVSGDIDEGLMKKMEFDRLSRLYLKFLYYVEAVREDMGTNRIWENLEFMCYRWSIDSGDIFDWLVDLFLLRPSLGGFQSQREYIRRRLEAFSATIP